MLADSERHEQLVLVVTHHLALRDPALAEAQAGAATEVDAGVVDLLEEDLVARGAVFDLYDAEFHERMEPGGAARAERQPLEADARQPVIDVTQVSDGRVVRGDVGLAAVRVERFRAPLRRPGIAHRDAVTQALVVVDDVSAVAVARLE